MSDNNVAINLIRSSEPQRRMFGGRTLARCCGALVVGMLLASLAQAALPLYRWTNDQGRQEYSHSISSDMVIRGYDILDGQSMRVVRRVQPQLSEKEYAVKLERERQLADCKRAMRRVITLYLSIEDIESAEAQMLKSMDSRIANAQANLALAENQRLALEQEAANKDRAGEMLQTAFISSIERVKIQIVNQRQEIEKRNREKDQAKLDFAEDRRVFSLSNCETDLALR